MDDPVVKIAGKDYSVPALVPRQQRIVIPALLRASTAFKALPDGQVVFDPEKMTTAIYDDMLNTTFWGVIYPSDKKATVAVLMDINLPFDEILVAINVVRQQTGMFKTAPEGATPGESSAAVKS